MSLQQQEFYFHASSMFIICFLFLSFPFCSFSSSSSRFTGTTLILTEYRITSLVCLRLFVQH